MIRFHFDFVSPYSYLAWTQIHGVAERHGRQVEPVPVLFAALLDQHGTKGPAEVAAKRRYLMFDLARKARMLGVPIGPPRSHPFNPLLLLRTASVPMEPAERRRLIDRLYAAVWSGEARDVEDRPTVVALVNECGLDGEAVVGAGESPDGKARVRTQTERLIADGAFGVPWMICEDEPFWGVDSLRELEAFLEAGAPTVDDATIARWSAIRPSAERRQR